MLARIVGRTNINLAKNWAKSLAGFGATGGLAFLYFTDWKLVLQYMPIYNTKFKEEE